MKTIVTLTLNPAIDGASETDVVRHTLKIRTTSERFDPGGGGINVARVVNRLGGRALAVYLAGGATGYVLDSLVEGHHVDHCRVDIAGDTRISHAVYERSSGHEYRFVPEGPWITDDECAHCLAALEDVDCDYLVASGSLPRGVADDFYCRVLAIARRRGARFVLDTSGEALRQTLACGGAFLVKPSIGEFEALLGRSLRNEAALIDAASGIIARGEAEHVVVTLGRDGALLVNADGHLRLPAIDVVTKSAVGAGDSFVGAMTYGFATGLNAVGAFRLGIAAGAATVLTPGTDLCHRADVERLLARMDAGLAS